MLLFYTPWKLQKTFTPGCHGLNEKFQFTEIAYEFIRVVLGLTYWDLHVILHYLDICKCHPFWNSPKHLYICRKFLIISETLTRNLVLMLICQLFAVWVKLGFGNAVFLTHQIWAQHLTVWINIWAGESSLNRDFAVAPIS